MGRDEHAALHALDAHRELLRILLPKFNGRMVGEIGDGTLTSFHSALEAVNCALLLGANRGSFFSVLAIINSRDQPPRHRARRLHQKSYNRAPQTALRKDPPLSAAAAPVLPLSETVDFREFSHGLRGKGGEGDRSQFRGLPGLLPST